MKPTGIIRQLDSMGRIVLPSDLRKNLELEERDSVEFFADDGMIILDDSDRINTSKEYIDAVNELKKGNDITTYIPDPVKKLILKDIDTPKEIKKQKNATAVAFFCFKVK